MIFLYNSNEGRLADLERKLKLAFPKDTIISFLSINDAMIYMETHIPDALYTEVGNKGDILVYQLTKDMITCYVAYISSNEEYFLNRYVHIGATAAKDYFLLSVTPDELRNKFFIWLNKYTNE